MKCSSCHCRYSDENKKTCQRCRDKSKRQYKKGIVPVVSTFDVIYKTTPITFKHFLDNIHISNVDIQDLKETPLVEKVIELIKYEYATLKEKPFYCFNKKKQVLLIFGSNGFFKHSIDDEDQILKLVKEHLLLRLIDKTGDIPLSFDKEKFYTALLDLC
jgi:hypothetical protein